jgi:CcmD family protein
MADAMRSSGKIYVVVGVIAIIFVGIAIYLFSIDRKLTKLEKEQQNLKR